MIFLCLWDTHGFETLESTAETLSNLVWAAAKENDPQDVAAVCVFTAEEWWGWGARAAWWEHIPCSCSQGNPLS